MIDNKFYWIKLKTDFFEENTIDFLMSQKNGSDYVVLYQMLCLKTANNNGYLANTMGEILVPYDIDKIARDCKYFTTDTIIVAMELYKQLGLIYEDDNNILKIVNISNMVGSESANPNAQRQKRYRERQKQSVTFRNGNNNGLNNAIYNTNSNDLSNETSVTNTVTNAVTNNNESIDIDIRDKSIDIDLDEEKEKISKKRKKIHIPNKNEILEYAKTRGRVDLVNSFYDYYTATDWYDVKGQRVRSWKGKFITWEKNNPKKQDTGSDAIDNLLKLELQKNEFGEIEI